MGHNIRRPLPSCGLGGAVPGITVGVQHGPGAFQAAIWHFRGATTCFYWASKLPSGTFPAALKTLKTLPAALPWDFPRPHETVSVGNCHLAVFLLGFAAAIWHFRGATTCFYWASKLPSGTFPAALKTLKTLPAALPWDFPRPHELFLLETAIWQCFCWASQLLSDISEALQPVSIGLRNCHPARFQQPLKPLKPCHGTSRGPTNCFCWKLPSGNVSVGLRSCYLAFPRRHELCLLVFETVILHVFSTP